MMIKPSRTEKDTNPGILIQKKISATHQDGDKQPKRQKASMFKTTNKESTARNRRQQDGILRNHKLIGKCRKRELEPEPEPEPENIATTETHTKRERHEDEVCTFLCAFLMRSRASCFALATSNLLSNRGSVCGRTHPVAPNTLAAPWGSSH